MRALTGLFLIAILLAGCCVGGNPPLWNGGAPLFNAFQAAMRLQVGMPADIAILLTGTTPASAEAKSCGVAAGYTVTRTSHLETSGRRGVARRPCHWGGP